MSALAFLKGIQPLALFPTDEALRRLFIASEISLAVLNLSAH